MKEANPLKGTVTTVDSTHLYVLPEPHAGCEGCKARTLCSPAAKRTVRIARPQGAPPEAFREGDVVWLHCHRHTERRAAVVAFLVPLLLTVGWLILSQRALRLSELQFLAGLAALLAAYYGLLYLLRKALATRFQFTLEKATTPFSSTEQPIS